MNLDLTDIATELIKRDIDTYYNHRISQHNIMHPSNIVMLGDSILDLNKYLAPNTYLEDKYSLDGLHLNGEAYLIWIEKIKPILSLN